jgi:hypothetical protein
MNTKNQLIDFKDYESEPEILHKIIIRCNKPTRLAELSQYSQKDIDKLISNEILRKNDDGTYEYYLANVNKLFNRYKRLMTEVYPVINLRKNILQFKLAWSEFSKLMCSLGESYTEIKPVSDEEIIKVEFHISNVLSMICKIRDGLKDAIIVTEDEKITKVLTDKYSNHQLMYNKLIEDTIDKPSVSGFNDFLRNRLLHGGSMLFNVFYLCIPLGNNRTHVLAIALCDYGMLDLSKRKNSNVKQNLVKYYFDTTTFFMKRLVNNDLSWESLDDGIQEQVENDIKIRLNTNKIDTSIMNSKRFKELLEDPEFTLYMYKLWRKNAVPNLGQFLFNITELLTAIYIEHLKLYTTLYQWVAFENNTLIKELLQLREKLISLEVPGLVINDELNFELL